MATQKLAHRCLQQLIYNCPNQATKKSFSRGMDKSTVLRPDNGKYLALIRHELASHKNIWRNLNPYYY